VETRPISLVFGLDGRHLRIETLTRLRWLALFGQLVSVLFVTFGLQFSMPLNPCLAVIAASAILNIVVELTVSKNLRLEDHFATAVLSFDVVQLSLLLYFTGGLENPFGVLLLAPVTIAAVSLRVRQIIIILTLVAFSASLLSTFHWPLPWYAGEAFLLPALYKSGLWISLLVATLFICAYAAQVAHEARNISLALAATELVLERQNHLSRLDGLAAAAAHELGTPLATIALISRELSNSRLPNEITEDLELLNQEVQRCRTILRRLTSLAAEEQPPLDTMKLRHLLENIAMPFRQQLVTIRVEAQGDNQEPVVANSPAFTFGIGSFLENAIDFAEAEVVLSAGWTDDHVTITIADDGPGFPNDIIGQIGEPYLKAKSNRRLKLDEGSGLGLGIFIAKTLLERTGAVLTFANQAKGGAVVEIQWNRRRLEIQISHSTS
jgi:two-component system, sensor histidine kinase RegB